MESLFIETNFLKIIYNLYLDGLSTEEILINLKMVNDSDLCIDFVNKIIDELNIALY